VPDWIVVPGGNLGNSSAFGKAFAELKHLGLIDRMPRLAVINAAGADTLFELVERRGLKWDGGNGDMGIANHYFTELDQLGRKASTIASAIEINRPVNLRKCLRALEDMNGVVRQHPDGPSAQGPHRHGRISHHRPGAIQQSPRQPRHPPRQLRQPRRRHSQ
jgi:threonine synthase